MINTFEIDISKFILKPSYFDSQSKLHGIKHTYRVMCLCLILGGRLHLFRETRLAFCAAFIHDMARLHDGYCDEHGRWAAENKLDKFKNLFLENKVQPGEIEEIRTAVINHSEAQNLAKHHLYYYTSAILKDADALDRIRLGEDNLNKEYLRFVETEGLVNPAKELYYQVDNLEKVNIEIVIEIAGKIIKK